MKWTEILKEGLDVPGISLRDGGFWSTFLGASNWTGKSVTVNSALQLSTAWACVRLIAETMSTLPVNLLRGMPDGSKVPDKSHQLHYLLHTQPNADMTAAVFWQIYLASLLLWGNAYVEKRMSVGVITSLEFLMPSGVTRRLLANGAIEWRYVDPRTGRVRTIPEDRMWHTPAFTLDGITGLSPVQMGANVFGSAIAADQASSETFSRGMRASGLVTMDALLQKDQRQQIREHVQLVNKEGGFFVLEKGAGFQQLTMNPQDAELLSTRGFNVEEICRWYGVWPVLVGHGDKTSNFGTGYEQQMLAFVVFLLRRWAVRIEQQIVKGLFTPAERLTHSAEFALEGLLRGDSVARAAFYSQMVQNGVFTRDEVRRLENLPLMGGNAEVLTVQSNLLPIDMLGVAGGGAGNNARDALVAWLAQQEKEPT
jgi:HK97 family phage portal protein